MEILQPKVGDRVRVRQRTWVVHDVDAFEHCRVLTLCGGGRAGTIRTCRVLQPFDDVEPVRRSRRLQRVGMRAWRRRCRALISRTDRQRASHSGCCAHRTAALPARTGARAAARPGLAPAPCRRSRPWKDGAGDARGRGTARARRRTSHPRRLPGRSARAVGRGMCGRLSCRWRSSISQPSSYPGAPADRRQSVERRVTRRHVDRLHQAGGNAAVRARGQLGRGDRRRGARRVRAVGPAGGGV